MNKPQTLKILEYDPYLVPFKDDLTLRVNNCTRKKKEILNGLSSLSDFANGHLYYGFHKTKDGWVYREWAPNADALYLIGDFNNWSRQSHQMKKIENGNFEIFLSDKDNLGHGSQVKVYMQANNEHFDRIPLYIKRAVQQPDMSFNGQVWHPDEQFKWTDQGFERDDTTPLFIYECHIGIASEEYRVATYNDFTNHILPRIHKGGYNAIQLMAIAEHPYYGSFGYQISNFFAPSSRFGTPEDLKHLINTAHNMGIAVLLDLVHSHAACNVLEGIAKFDGTEYQFFHEGAKGDHPAWGTKLFNYNKNEVIHFLLSNVKFWLTEYHFDGFRFDGITSMLYHDHGLGKAFDNYEKYFSLNTDTEAITYLQLTAELSKEINPKSVLIAEDMSGMPGMCVPVGDGGIGFDYRLAMGIPDLWINTLKNKRDEDWNMGHLWYELSQRRPHEKVIGYCESHDQALVGDKTIMFWLADKEMYWNMGINSQSLVIDRAMALHKMIRLITCSCAGEGYLNFMGNEFGHPEWIDFPREGNGWSYHYARRQWNLVDNGTLRYQYLQAFDNAMINLEKANKLLNFPSELVLHDEGKKTIAFMKGKYLFVFNFHPSYDCEIDINIKHSRNCQMVLHTNRDIYGGYMNAYPDNVKINNNQLRLLVDKRSAVVYKFL